MREILYRGQTRKYGEKVRIVDGQKLPGRWVYGGVLQGAGSHSIIYGGENINDPSQNIEKWCVHTDTLGQYTGLKDKHGKRIFEGDIVKTDKFSEPNKQYIIKYDLQFGAFIGQDRYNLYFVTFDGDSGEFEVIGNIHDNPELLEK